MRNLSTIGTRRLRTLGLVLALLVAGAAGTRAAPAPSPVSIDLSGGPSSVPALVRRLPDGAVDFRFGKDGRAAIEGMAPRGLTEDSLGRIVVVGTTLGAPAQPMLQRFSNNGWIDPSFGSGGRSVQPPTAGAASGIEALVLDDGRILVLGQLDDGDLPRPALWTVDASGRFEPDWLAWIDTPSATALSLVSAGDDSVMVALGVPRAPAAALEAFVFVPARDLSSMPERLVQTRAPLDWGTDVRLERDGGRRWRWLRVGRNDVAPVAATASIEAEDRPPLWAWRRGAPPPTRRARPETPAVPMVKEASAPGGAIYSPFAQTGAQPVAVATEAAAPDRSDLWIASWWIAGLVAAALAGMLWKARRGSVEDD